MFAFMPKDVADLLAVLDGKIAAETKELEAAKRAAERISELTNDLFALKRARQLLAGDSSQSAQALIAEINAPPARTATGQNGSGSEVILPSEPAEISIGASVLATLKAAGKPLKVEQLLSGVKVRGKPDLTYHTLSAVLSQYKAKGKIRRVRAGTYGLPADEVRRG